MTTKKIPEPPIDDEFGPDRSAFLPAWKFADDGPFTGTILTSRIVQGLVGLDRSPRDVPLFTIVSDDGERFSLWGSGMLSRVLPEHMGHRVRITDSGLEPQGDGTNLRVFDVRCATCFKAEQVGGAPDN